MANPDTMVIDFDFAEVAAGTDETWYATVALTGTWRLDAVYFVSKTARTANDTNFTTISVKNGSDVVATQTTETTGSGNLVAGTPIAIPITGTGTTLEFDKGDALSFLKADTASGLALDGLFSVALTEIRA